MTTFPAQGREGASEVREKVLEWLRANQSRPEPTWVDSKLDVTLSDAKGAMPVWAPSLRSG